MKISSCNGFTGEYFHLQEEIFVARAPGRLDVVGGIADYSGSLVLQVRFLYLLGSIFLSLILCSLFFSYGITFHMTFDLSSILTWLNLLVSALQINFQLQNYQLSNMMFHVGDCLFFKHIGHVHLQM